MGQVASRVNQVFHGREVPVQTEEDDPEQNVAFPNDAGSYFGSHFLMCGNRFELSKPEAYLFGENSDLDLLGSRAVPFPYASPLGSDEVHPLNLLINIRKESVKFVRLKDDDGNWTSLFQLEFTLDAECSCSVQIHFNAREFYHEGDIHFAYRNKNKIHSETFNFDMGCDQTFNNFIFDMSDWDLEELHYTGGHYFPLVILIQTDGVDTMQIQTTMCTIEPSSDAGNCVLLKPLRQKIASDGVIYLLQEIFGIENKEQTMDMGDEGGLECIICMSDVRDTVILPCRHLCICNNCADTLRYKLNNCPICRSPFRALIQLRAKRQTRNQGYETVTLVEGLNGPINHQLTLEREGSSRYTTPVNDNSRSQQHKRYKSNESSSTGPEELAESSEGIEMKRYVPKEVKVITLDETPVLSNVSSRSHSPNGYATADDVEVELENGHVSRTPPQSGSGQSSDGLLEEGRDETVEAQPSSVKED